MDNIKTPNMEVTGLDELSKKLDRLQAKDSQMEQRITKIIREAIKAARSMVTQDAKGAVGNDPRHAYKAVRSMVYKRILGGNISILQKRKAGSGKSGYEPPRTLRPGQRTAGTRNGRLHGNRGSIAARNWFPSSGQRAMNAAAQYIIDEIDRLIADEFGK